MNQIESGKNSYFCIQTKQTTFLNSDGNGLRLFMLPRFFHSLDFDKFISKKFKETSSNRDLTMKKEIFVF